MKVMNRSSIEIKISTYNLYVIKKGFDLLKCIARDIKIIILTKLSLYVISVSPHDNLNYWDEN